MFDPHTRWELCWLLGASGLVFCHAEAEEGEGGTWVEAPAARRTGIPFKTRMSSCDGMIYAQVSAVFAGVVDD